VMIFRRACPRNFGGHYDSSREYFIYANGHAEVLVVRAIVFNRD
jgi:hypothetical protein